MNTIRELRAARDAAQAALTATETDPTSTENEIRKRRREFRAAHDAWIAAVADAASGPAYQQVPA